MDFQAFVVRFFHTCCPVFSRGFAKRSLSGVCGTAAVRLFPHVFPEFFRLHPEFLEERVVEGRTRHSACLDDGIDGPVGMPYQKLVGVLETEVLYIGAEGFTGELLEQARKFVLGHMDDLEQLRAREV